MTQVITSQAICLAFYYSYLETAPCRIENLQISVSDNDRFDKSARQAQSIKSAIKNMNSRPRKDKKPMDFYIIQIAPRSLLDTVASGPRRKNIF